MEIVNVERVTGELHHEPVEMWAITTQRPEGTIVHFMPTDIFLIRAAEYDLAPDDLDTVIDLVVAESMVGPRDIPRGDHLYDAPSIEHARQKYISLCARKKLEHRISTRSSKAKQNPLDVIRNHLMENPMDVHEYALHQNRVFEGRRESRAHTD